LEELLKVVVGFEEELLVLEELSETPEELLFQSYLNDS
jgi:hypothetical protein